MLKTELLSRHRKLDRWPFRFLFSSPVLMLTRNLVEHEPEQYYLRLGKRRVAVARMCAGVRRSCAVGRVLLSWGLRTSRAEESSDNSVCSVLPHVTLHLHCAFFSLCPTPQFLCLFWIFSNKSCNRRLPVVRSSGE